MGAASVWLVRACGERAGAFCTFNSTNVNDNNDNNDNNVDDGGVDDVDGGVGGSSWGSSVCECVVGGGVCGVDLGAPER